MTRYVRNSGGAWHTGKLRLSFPKQFFAQFGLHTSRFAHYRSCTVCHSHNSIVFWPVVNRNTCSLWQETVRLRFQAGSFAIHPLARLTAFFSIPMKCHRPCSDNQNLYVSCKISRNLPTGLCLHDMSLRWIKLAHICFQVTSLRKGNAVESISNCFHRISISRILRILSPEMWREIFWVKCWRSNQSKSKESHQNQY